MGSISRWNAMNFAVKIFANKVEDYFKSMLVGKTIESREEISVDYFVETNIKIDNEQYLMHHRWASEEEADERMEIIEEGEWTLAEYFDERVKGQVIKEVKFESTDRDDELYLICILENDYTVDIPMGFSSEDEEFYGYLKEILTEEDIECYHILRSISIVAGWYHTNREVTFEKKTEIYNEILEALGIDGELEYEISDFHKIPKIKQIVEGDIKNVTETVAAIERVIYQ